MTTKPLFIPLKAEHYDAFASGRKLYELRRYGPRWNETVCTPGRAVVLSKGYGKQHRLAGAVEAFSKLPARRLCNDDCAAILAIYGTLDIDIAQIYIWCIRTGADA